MTDVTSPRTTDALPPPPPPPRRLERARSGRMVAGVCEGLGRYFDVDPVIFRVGFAVTAVAGGAGLLAYLIAWLVIPEEGSGRAPLHLGRGTPTWLPIILVVIGLLALGDAFDHGGPGFGSGLVLVGIGAWLLWHRDQQRRAAPAPAPSTNPAPISPDTDEIRAEDVVVPPPPEPPSVLGRVAWSVLLVLAGGAILLDRAGALDVTLVGFLGTALVVVGAALVVGAWAGRARGLIGLGVVLTVVAGFASVVDVPLRGGVGERRWAPVTQVRDEYRWGVGDAELDLTAVDRDVRTRVRLGIGSLVVIVPADATVAVDAHAGAGNVDLFGREADGIDVDREIVSRGSELGPGVELDLRVGLGELEVHRAAA